MGRQRQVLRKSHDNIRLKGCSQPKCRMVFALFQTSNVQPSCFLSTNTSPTTPAGIKRVKLAQRSALNRHTEIMQEEPHEDIESQPLLLASSPDAHTISSGRKQEQWAAYLNQSDHQLVTSPTPSTRTLLLFAGAIMISILTTVSFFAFCGTFNCLYTATSNKAQTTIGFAPPQIQHSWGAYTPYFPVKPYIPPPSHCHITQVRSIYSSSHCFSAFS